MTKKEAQIRNNKIMQFRGTALRVRYMIPDDIWRELSNFDKILINDTQKVYKKVIRILNSKVKCRHSYYHQYVSESRIYIQDTKCNICGHIKYSRDGLGKVGTF